MGADVARNGVAERAMPAKRMISRPSMLVAMLVISAPKSGRVQISRVRRRSLVTAVKMYVRPSQW
jgi:hypothetical protein